MERSGCTRLFNCFPQKKLIVPLCDICITTYMSQERSNSDSFLFIFYEKKPPACSHTLEIFIHTDASRVSPVPGLVAEKKERLAGLEGLNRGK